MTLNQEELSLGFLMGLWEKHVYVNRKAVRVCIIITQCNPENVTAIWISQSESTNRNESTPMWRSSGLARFCIL